VEFLAELQPIRDNTCKTSTIRASWRETGLVPWNPATVVEKLRARQAPPPATPLSSEPLSDRTPQELSSLVRRASYIQLLSLSPSVRKLLLPVLKAGVVTAGTNEL
jgi:hypothetical protein